MSSTSSSQTLSSTSVQHSNELIDLTSCSTNPTSFAPLHRTVELENLHDFIKNDEKQITITTKKILTKCMTVIGDGSDKQI
ncbi:unnamed protein product [Rotaria sp. Silwood1]|nr:unnamed protein product [Rotaria sp. Silwood1]CAF1628179.1 unnamed protein product [Rotaria sp. Silwood1]CAF3771212.1 unnamed protein product [Rotaria sp. Silwood1]CAF4866004.1 unnamed protein product [Rotaria sp. Silwood1]